MQWLVFLVSLLVDRVSAGPLAGDIKVNVLEAIYEDVQWVEEHPPSEDYCGVCSVCYDGLGCIEKCRGYFYYIAWQPQSPDKISTQFTLYSRQNPDEGVSFDFRDVSAASKFLDAPRMLFFLVHGFASSAQESWMIDLRRNILKDSDAIVITVDWSKGSCPPFYAKSVVNTQVVGREIAVVLQKLMELSPENVNPGTTHYIGHSLGAQMAKFFSEYFRTLSGGLLISRITALDPASPLFEVQNVCLNSSAATFVDGIHTSAGINILLGKLGVTRQVGHVDFYVNGGTDQPGCSLLDITCAHNRAHDYYVEAVKLDSDCSFASYACAGGIREYKRGKCRKVPGEYNQISLDKSIALPGRGVQFVDTKSSSPFCT
ncbi:phospholipase A1 [Galendromus occidentalis]|uniref:Phospholipase A1 n=1 Tax=Galendromus occidentalis TaxID=34638 RepID=A0AAJ6QRP4_9ACAR|nr:phospholipase A1 [Galendromus occidentalis]